MGRGEAGEEIVFAPLSEAPAERYVELMNNEAVARHLPLLTGEFTIEAARAFLQEKQRMWAEHGFGPSAIMIGGEFAGWGGLQPEDGEADFALVLRPEFWGWGLKIFRKVKAEAFGPLGLDSITILLPPDRPNLGAVARLGFREDGVVEVDGAAFKRFRLSQTGNAETPGRRIEG